MYNNLVRRSLTAICSVILFSSVTFSQVENVDFLRAGPVDGVKILEAYVTPWANAFAAGVNGSWYNSAKPHKLGGFDLTLSANFGFAPSSDNTFDVSKIGLTTFTGSGMAPSISGKETGMKTLTGPSVGGVAPVSITTPPGTDWDIMPVPTLQAGIGLPLGSEVKVRYVPKVNLNGGDFSSWGVGLLHSIMQYIPGEKVFPLDVSLFGGYNKLEGNVHLDLQPDPSMPSNYTSRYPAGSFDDQNLNATVEAWNVSVIASINLPVISFYGGLGYAKTSTLINMTGYFPLPTVNTSISSTTQVYEDAGVLKDFPAIDIKNFSGVRTNIGFRLKFAAITFHADYTWAQYSVVSTGLGISFR